MSNDNNGLFAAQPAVDASGTLTYTPAANANGSATVTVNVSDDGGTALGGVDTSADQTFVITVNAVNDAPSFVKGADETVDEDDPAQTVVGWATAISVGPVNESSQSITGFNVSNDNNGLFAAQPAVDASGTLTYTPAGDANGSATVTLSVSDDGGTALGGVDTSADQTFVITVNAVNDAPVAVADAGYSLAEGATLDTSVSGDPLVVANDTDAELDSLTAVLDVGPVNASAFTLNADGSFTYTHDGSETTSDSFTYFANDGTTNSASSVSVSITISPVNDAPQISNQNMAIDENVADGTPVGTVVATDPEGDPISYAIIAGNGGGWFTINSTTGAITVNNPPGVDHEAAASRSLVVEVSDPAPATNSAIVAITINDVNDPPVLDPIANQSAIEDVPWSLTVSSADQDVPAQSLTLTQTGLPAWATFTDNGDGTATLAGTPGAADIGPNVVTVTVSDGTATDAQPFNLDVFSAGGSIIINEVLYEEQLASGDEFIELYNASAGPIDLTGWTIADGKETPPPDRDPVGSLLAFSIPANDVNARPATLGSGEYAVIWLQSRGGKNIAPFAALEFDVALGAEWPLSNIADDLYLYDPGMGLSDYVTWGDDSLLGAEQNTPPATVWDESYDVANWSAIPALSGTSLSLTPTGVDSGTSACWEATGSGDAAVRPECAGAPGTYAADVDGRMASPGLNNNLPYPHSLFEHQIVINEVMYEPSDYQYVELHNPTGGPIDISGWLLADGNARTGDLDGGGSSVTYGIPGGTSIPAGGYAVVWLQSDDPSRKAPQADVELYANANNSALKASKDDMWLFEPNLDIVDYVAWGSVDNPPPQPLADFWDDSNQAVLNAAGFGTSISLTANGIDTDDSNCWEVTTAGTSGCGPVTVDNNDTPFRHGSPGADNNLAVADIEVTVISSTPQPTSGTNMTYT
ncbi:MAG: tandem-95 repeat protein, partial [Acidimicrobiales bacterium]|nr:tandem-95 repeat protein [Acidimicrobiales bacterium]